MRTAERERYRIERRLTALGVVFGILGAFSGLGIVLVEWHWAGGSFWLLVLPPLGFIVPWGVARLVHLATRR